MKYRIHRGLKVSEIGIGCYALSGAYGSVVVKQFQRMLQHAHTLGVNFFDTAEGYGAAEKILGEAVKSFREEILIATKVGIRESIKPNLSIAYIEKACNRSLEQLQTDYIDLYQVHFDDPDTSVQETIEALDTLVEKGKIRYYGVGHLPIERVKSYCEQGSPFFILMELSAVARRSRQDRLPLCQSKNVAAIAFSTTGRGILTGKYGLKTRFEASDLRNWDPLFQHAQFRSALRIKDKIAELAQKYDKTPVQLAIAWVLAQPDVICALTGSSKIKHLEENLGGSGWNISKKDMDQLEQFFKKETKSVETEDRLIINQIVSKPLPSSINQAFTDLVYVLETGLNLGLLSEQSAFEVLEKLWPLKTALNESIRPKLAEIQSHLKSLIN
jgi:aryl-alcohol dehydrogenase-like predicted oxidoreductase